MLLPFHFINGNVGTVSLVLPLFIQFSVQIISQQEVQKIQSLFSLHNLDVINHLSSGNNFLSPSGKIDLDFERLVSLTSGIDTLPSSVATVTIADSC